jgi:hypothetical protein
MREETWVHSVKLYCSIKNTHTHYYHEILWEEKKNSLRGLDWIQLQKKLAKFERKDFFLISSRSHARLEAHTHTRATDWKKRSLKLHTIWLDSLSVYS